VLGGILAGGTFWGQIGGLGSNTRSRPDREVVVGVVFGDVAGAGEDGGGAIEAG